MNNKNMSFKNGPAPNFSKTLIHDLKNQVKNICLVCFRNKNKNVVIYEANLKNDGTFDDEKPIIGYWLIIDEGKEYRPARRKLGIQHDREEFTWFEENFVYGITSTKKGPHKAQFTFKSCPEKHITVLIKNREAKSFIAEKGQKYLIKSLYIKASENIHLVPLSKNLETLYLDCLNIKTKSNEKVYLKQ